jgi:hypothetical protein
LFVSVFVPIATGCALLPSNLDVARDAYVRGDLTLARETLQPLAKSRRKTADPANLDLAIVELAAGQPKQAEQRLRKLRDRFDTLPSMSAVGNAASMVTDDNTRRFRPAGYEEVMIRAMLAVTSIASDLSDAESYAMQAMMKQESLANDASQRGLLEIESAYQPIAFAPYLRGVLREATHHDYDDAARAYTLVSHVQPDFAPAQDDISRATGGAHCAPGHGVLYVIACVGRGPIRVEKVAETTTAALGIASSVLNAQTSQDDSGHVGGVILPNLASVKVPDVLIPPSQIQAVGIRVGGKLYGATQTITDVGTLARNQNEAEMPWTIARAVTRRVTKESMVAGTRNALGIDGAVGSLVHFAAVTAWSATESADTRCWGLLPREIQVFRGELPIGEHAISLTAMNSMGQEFARAVPRSVSIVDAQNKYLVVLAPDQTIYFAN